MFNFLKWSPAAYPSPTVDTQSGAFMPVTVGPEGSGLMVVGSMQHYLVKRQTFDVHLNLSPQDFRSKQTSGRTCVWKLS